ncbi:EAL domain-containing protein [uncultured Paraglaciecola sp.]|uniref:sensor domain-containing protein n=1 Tax=uncultured Paraglaciecola sp. TaxID=1765024 RepID=UPI0030DCE01D|tara:strand:- start:197609 stop:201223 length:3615 start_codon:yes stop_codon:yes gene_type:complete
MKLNALNSSTYHAFNDFEQLFKIVFNQQSQFMVLLTPEGIVLEVNEFALTSQGITREDCIGKLFWHLPPWCDFSESSDIWKQRLDDASKQQEALITEDVFQAEGGTIHYLDTSTTANYASNKSDLSGYIIQYIDTTKRRLKEKKIQESASRLERVLEQCHIGIWDYNHIDNSSHRSLTHDQIFGYDSLIPEWNYEMFLEHVIPEERTAVDNKFQQAIKNKTDCNIECQIRRNDGEIRWILASSGHATDLTGRANLRAGTIQDITELKQSELNKLRHSAELESLFNALPDVYFRMTLDGTILDYRAPIEDDQYTKTKDYIGKKVQGVFPKNIAQLYQSKVDEVVVSEKTIVFKYQLIINTKVMHFDARLNKIPHNDQLICVIRDVTKEAESKESLVASEQLFRSIFEQAAIGVGLVSVTKGTFIRINQRFCDMLGYSVEEMLNETHFKVFTHPDDLLKSVDNREKILSGQQREVTIEKRYLHKYGHTVWVKLTMSPTWKIGEHPQNYIVVVQDISLRKKAEETLKLSSRVFSDTHEGIMITDAQQVIVDVNPAFVKITGYSHDEVIGESPRILSSGKQSPQFYAQMWKSITEQGHWQGEVWNRTKQGELYSELLNISSLTNEHDEVTHYVAVFSDITSIKHQQDKLNLMAHYDVLTNLPNRTLFIDRFHQAIAHSKRTGHKLAVCFLDLDDFKPLNDTYGHEAGDRLLIEVAERIIGCIREEDTLSRQGGDEFAILLNDIESASQYETTMQRIHQALALPYFINGVQHNITASSGVTLYPSDNADIDTLLRHADHAMYQSKLAGKHRSQLYNPDSDKRIIQKNLQLEEIEQALVNSEFRLYYQPKVNMITGEVFGVEALIRWFHPEKGLIPPLDFLPYIDGTPLESKIGEWVINEALQQLDNWQRQGIEIEVSVNISSNHLLLSSFFVSLEKSLAAHPNIAPRYLQLEILESSALGDLNAITHIIETCQNLLGVNASLDDFGTGYSSLTHLRSLPVNTIKIDQSFVRDMLDDPSDYSIIDGVISLTKSFNRKVIAEGVETTNHGLMLILMGCELAQGYGIAKPMSAADLCRWLNNYIPNEQWLLCGNKDFNNKESSLEIFKLITSHWQQCISSKIAAPQDDVKPWPIIDSKVCHCGNWIRLKTQEQLFEKEFMLQLKHAHHDIHTIAQQMQRQYQSGNIQAARTDLVNFDLAFGVMNKIIALLSR